MSWWPFVSRGRYEDMRQRVHSLENEQRELIDRVLILSGNPPLYQHPAPPSKEAPAAPAAEPQREEGKEKDDLLRIVRPTRAEMRRTAERAKNGH